MRSVLYTGGQIKIFNMIGCYAHDRPPSDQQICALTTTGQFMNINNIMPWLDVWLFDDMMSILLKFTEIV